MVVLLVLSILIFLHLDLSKLGAIRAIRVVDGREDQPARFHEDLLAVGATHFRH